MKSSFPLAEPQRRIPASGPVPCRECGEVMAIDRESQALCCPDHGVLIAKVSGNALWEGQTVVVLHPCHNTQARYVVRFPEHRRRTIWFGHLRTVGMRPLSWLP